MNFTMETIVTISDKIKHFIQSGNYEQFILELLNQSTKLFPGSYEYIYNQSNNQCDFIDIKTEEKYEAKLLITSEQGRLVGSRNSDYLRWICTMLEEVEEFDKYIKDKGRYKIEDFQLYKLMHNKLLNIKCDENAILFIPFIISREPANSIYFQFATDILSVIFNKLKENEVVGSRKVYAIYPCIDGGVLVRHLGSCVREHIKNDKLQEYISFDVGYSTF